MRAERSPKVSVIVPTYNRSRLLGDAVRSALDQTLTDLEVIVVDDGSTDDTPEVVAALRIDPRLRYVRQARHGRAGPARNTGIRHSRGEFVAFLDDDDVWLPTKLERQLEALTAEPRAGVAWCAVHLHYLGADGEVRRRRVQRYLPERHREPLTGPFVQGPGSTLVVRAGCFERVGLFDEGLLFSDLDMTQRLGAVYPFVYVDEPLAVYRMHQSNAIARTDRVIREWSRFMARLRRRTPPDRHHLIPVVQLIRNGNWIGDYLRAGRHGAAARLFLRFLGIALRHPLALPRALLSYGERRLVAPLSRDRPERRLVSFTHEEMAQESGRRPAIGRGR